MTNIRIFKITLLIFVLVVTTAALRGDDSRNHPVTAAYCDKSTISIYPYSFVIRDDQSTFKCYEVKTNPITDGIRYQFEDSNDMDYNDVVIDVWTTRNDSGQPRLNVRLISTDAGYRHQIHIVYNNRDINLFDVGQTSPGAVFTHILPARDCPEFTLDISPKSQTIGSGGQAVYRITVHPSNGFSSLLRLKAGGLPKGVSASFYPPDLLPRTESDLTLQTSQETPEGKYFFTVEAAGGGLSQSINGLLEVFKIDLKISKTVDKTTAKPGDILNYDLLLKNDSSKNLDNLTVEDKLSEDLLLLSQSSRFNFSREEGQLKWQGDLKQGKILRIKIQARLKPGVIPPNVIVNQAEARSDIIPEGLKSNQVVTTVSSEPIPHSAITFTKDVNRPQTELGRIVRFRLSVINRSGSILINPGLIDYLPQGFSYIPGSTLIDFKKYPDPLGKNTISWQLPDIGPGQSVALSFQTVIGTDTRRGKM